MGEPLKRIRFKSPVEGRMVKLDDASPRSVFVGFAPTLIDEREHVLIRFVNSEGENTEFGITPEAGAALLALLLKSEVGEPHALWRKSSDVIRTEYVVGYVSVDAVEPDDEAKAT